MSPIARVMLGLTTAFCSLVFLLIGRIPNVGFASFMTIMGLLCGVATVLLFFPYDRVFSNGQGKKKRKRKRAAQEASHEPTSIYEMDLTRVSLPGCLLFVATVGLVAVFAIVVGSSLGGQEVDRRTMKKIGFIGFIIIVGFFFGGKFLLEALGMSMTRQPKKKSRKGKGKRKRRRPRVE